MEEKTTINMESMDPEEGEKQEDNNLPVEPPKEEEKKPGLFRKVWNGITFVPRWCGRKLKESPAAGAVGTVIGAGLALGVKAGLNHFRKGTAGDEFIPADQPEIEVSDYEYVNSDDSTTYTTEE